MKQLCRWVASKRNRSYFSTEINTVDRRLKKEYENLYTFRDPSINELGVFGGGVFGNVRLDGSLNQRCLSKKAKTEFNL